MRLPRSRRGKTEVEVDVVITEQDGLRRVRLTMGAGTVRVRNTDMDEQEVENLIVLLQYKLEELRGNTP